MHPATREQLIEALDMVTKFFRPHAMFDDEVAALEAAEALLKFAKAPGVNVSLKFEAEQKLRRARRVNEVFEKLSGGNKEDDAHA